MTVHDYIKENWKNTIRSPQGKYENSPFNLPKPYTTPCADETFINFFYWDTYFTNIGLLCDGMDNQAENNLDDMKFFINILGYIPNADHIVMRTQPPFFTRGVYDLYKYRQDENIIKKYIDFAIKELNYFNTDKNTKCGLNAYNAIETNAMKLWYYDALDKRIRYTDEEKKTDKFELVDNLLSIAESGWDFNPRFTVKGNRFAAKSFAHLDLNCILFDAENKISEMLGIIGRDAESAEFKEKACSRAKLTDKLMLNSKDGIYYDYNYENNSFSNVLSAASFYPYAFGISADKNGALKVLERLDLPFGISACEYRGEGEEYLQWDYPNMWPTNMYLAYLAMKNTGLKEKAEEIAFKYMNTVEKVFEETGGLWEKYNAGTGSVSVTNEYKTPQMMGWTAGIYEYFYFLNK